MASNSSQRRTFFPKADAAVLSSKNAPPSAYPQTIAVLDPNNLETPVGPWPANARKSFYPPKPDDCLTSPIPRSPMCLTDGYLRAFLAENEWLRLSMLWYYTRDIFSETEFLSGLQEKVYLAQESTGWEFVVIGVLDVNFYTRLATIGLPLGILPRGETICAHTVTQPPGSVFLLPNMLEDWRFQASPYVESGGLRAYAGAPLRIQNESGDCVALGSLCVASRTRQEPLTKAQQRTLARLADWVVSDMIQCTRARRQRERRRMTDLISTMQRETDDAASEESVLRALRGTYPEATISLQSSQAAYIELEGRAPIFPSDLEDGLWEDSDYMDDFIANSNHQKLPSDRVIRVMAAKCENMSGPSLLIIASKDFRLIFDDIDSWFLQSCAVMLSQMWQKRLLAEAMRAKEKFLRGFSHQLRTPIHGILGSVELLAEELRLRSVREIVYPESALPEAARASTSGGPLIYLDTIKRAGRDLISVVNSMITLNTWADIAMTDRQYATYTVKELERELADETVKAISEDTRHGASIFFDHDLPSDCDSLRIDLSLVRHSLIPLIINAVQNTTAGVVTVTTSIHLDSKELIVDVKDTGRGIHPDHRQRIFELYEKVGVHSTGAGLGLTLASKFAELLHGSVVLVSSDVGRGSHFRATFREVELAQSALLLRPLAPKLQNLPSKFYVMESGSDGKSLCDYFIKYLAPHGFDSSDRMEDCFIILDFMPGLEQRLAQMSRIPPHQVAICLVPASQGPVGLDDAPSNVIYASGPFLSSTVSATLENADRLLAEIKASRARLVRPEDPCLTLPKIDESTSADESASADEGMSSDGFTSTSGSTSTNESLAREEYISPYDEAEPITDSPRPKGQLALPPGDDLVDTGVKEVMEPPTYELSQVALIESTVNILNFPAFSSVAKPTSLIVDDNFLNLRIMQMYCSKRGLPYLCATDGQQAIEIFSQHQALCVLGEVEPIQLILMDLQMPVCDGIEATRQIRLLEKRNKWRESTVFIVTGQDSPTDRQAAEYAGAEEYFVKPVSIKNLDRGVKRYFPAFESNSS